MCLSLFKNFGCVTAYNFMKINIITPNYVYYMIVRPKLSYEYSMTLFLHKI